jgi:drug/metabolite transporter (DMT)-like permease
MSSSTFSGTWRMALAMALSGTIGLAVTESGQAPLTVVFFRCLIGGAAMVAWLTIRRGWRPMERSDWAWLAVGGLALVSNWLCLFTAYRYSSISVATVVYHTQPFMLLALVALVQGEPLQRERLPWLVLAFVGVALIAEVHRGGQGAASWLGVLLACGAAFLYAVATLVTRRLKHLPPAQIASFQMVIGVVVLLPLASPGFGPVSDRGLIALATLGLVHTAFMYTIMYGAFQRLPAQSIAALSFIYPVVALLVDRLIYGVHLSATQFAGMAAILLAVVADQRKWQIGSPWRQAAKHSS